MTPDPVEELNTAWTAWEQAPGSRHTVARKETAITALGLDGNWAHDHIAQWRRNGYSIPDAIQSMLNNNTQEAA